MDRIKNLWERFQAWVQANPVKAAIWAGVIILIILGFVIPVPPPHVALSGEPLFSDGPDWLTNSVVTTIVVDIIVILLAVLATARMKLIPSGWQNVMEIVIETLYGLSESIAGRYARRYFPWVATIFLFVLISNWSGLIPGVGSIGYYHEDAHVVDEGEHALVLDRQLAMADGNLVMVDAAVDVAQPAAGVAQEEAEEEHATFVPLFRAPSADLNMTFALALVVMVMVQVWGVTELGGNYFRKFYNVSGKGAMRWINGFVGVLELISEFSRILAFGFRLFGNIFAGEIVLATMAFLIAFLLPIPFYVLEIFVGFVQALVFMMLALVFFTMATIGHGHDEHEHEPSH